MMRKLRVMIWEVMALSLVFSLNASAATLARQCGAVGIVTYDPLPVLPAPAGMLARQCGAVGIVTYDPIPLTEPTNTVMSVIESVADWNALCAAVADGAATEGTIVRLACNVGPVTTMVGTSEYPFTGVFDGGSNTLTVALSGSSDFIAPFSRVSGATILNLKVAGTVSGRMHCSGLVGAIGGSPNLIESCEVSAAISSSGSHFGGFIGHSATNAVTLRGCVFSGSLSGGTYVATFHGWSDDGAAMTLIDCLDASASDQPIGRGYGAACVSNTYYVASKNFGNGERLWSEGKRGRRAYAVTAGEGVALGFGEPLRVYGGSDLAVHPAGLAHGGSFYAEGGASVGLWPVFTGMPPAGKKHDAFQASAGDFAKSGDGWELVMPAGDVVVSATFADATAYEIWAVANGVEGAWDEADALGIHNVFRYAFDKPTGAFAEPPLLDIAIEDGNAVVKTPPIVNSEGFALSVVESSDIAGATVTRSRLLDAAGRAVFAMGGVASRFYRLSARPGDANLGGVQLWANGPYWAECNVGATKPEEYGYYFWWGDTVGYTPSGGTLTNNFIHPCFYSGVTWVSSTGEQMSNSPFDYESCPTYDKENAELLSAGYIDSTGNLVAAHDAATAHLGAPWRMPTSAEIDALVSNCTTTWITTNGVYGRLVTGQGAYANRSIFLPAAGFGSGSSFYDPGSQGDFWASTPISDFSYNAWRLYFNSSSFRQSDYSRYLGQPVRPVRDPDE